MPIMLYQITNITDMSGCKITGISKRKNRFAVTSADGQQFYGDRVILTTGGRAEIGKEQISQSVSSQQK